MPVCRLVNKILAWIKKSHMTTSPASGRMAAVTHSMTDRRIIPNLPIVKAVYGGYGLGFANEKAVFVPGALPGETVKVELCREKGSYSFGAILEIEKASDKRQVPACPIFGRCGGCSYLMVPYEDELAIKKEILVENLRRIGGMQEGEFPAIDIVAGERHHYRSHTSLKSGAAGIGFFRSESNILEPLPCDGCLLLAPELNRWARNAVPGIPEIRVAMDADHAVFDSANGATLIREREGGLVFDREIGQFFQGNRFLRSRMLELVASYAGLAAGSSFLDIGCGVGFFSLRCGLEGGTGTGIDINNGSIRRARQNAKLNDIGGVNFQRASASDLHPGRVRAEVAIIDPPRAGLSEKGRKTVVALRPATIVSVSCNPTTFARDLRDFARAGYRTTGLTMIDMFPCTSHLEIVARLELDQ